MIDAPASPHFPHTEREGDERLHGCAKGSDDSRAALVVLLAWRLGGSEPRKAGAVLQGAGQQQQQQRQQPMTVPGSSGAAEDCQG